MRARPWVAVVLALLIVAVVLSAFVAQRGGSAEGGPGVAAGTIGAPFPPVERVDRPMRPVYAGPRTLLGPATLSANVRRAPARVVAVTFMLDGEPLGTDTTAPYTLDVDGSLLAPGPHRLRVAAVDRLGARAASRPVRVHAGGGPSGVLTASPTRGLARALAALAQGDVTVQLRPGRYVIPHMELGTGARLVGSGPQTVIAAAGGDWALVTLRGRGIRVSDLAIDGGGLSQRGIAVASDSHDVRLQRLRIGGVLRTGVEVWGAHSDVSVQDSIITGAGASGAGVFELGSEASRDMSVVRTRISGFRSHGINFAQRAYDRPAAALHGLALDNRISDINDPDDSTGRHEGGIWSGGVAAAIIGNRVRGAGTDGIQTVGSSARVTVVGNHVARTPVGIYLEHETNDSLFARNLIADVATGINVEWRYEDAGSSGNTFQGNRIVAPSDAGVFVDVAGNRNLIARNVVVGGSGPAVVLQGASGNLVSRNRACARGDEPVVVEQSARHDDGRAAHSLANRLVANERVRSCEGR